MRQRVQSPVQVGAVIDGKYRIEEFVGSGAMSVVALALHLELEQLVAIKFLHALGFDHEQSAQRFKREARAAARIQSEHVARVLDVGTIPEGCPYIVMEHLRGNDLARELTERGPLPAAEVASYVLQACEALAEAHAAGIVHRDIKPENLFLAERADGSRSVKVLDFGISKSMSKSVTDLGLTGTASFMGSPLYMSPEQMRSSRSVDARTDIWSIGTVMYEMVSGHIPFTAESIPELCLAVIGEQPKPLAELTQELPPGFDKVVARCLEKDRELRYSTVAELARALAPFAQAGTNSAERTGRILALSTAAAENQNTPAPVSRTTARPTSPASSLVAQAPGGTLAAALRKVWGQRHARSAVAGALGLAVGVLWMSRDVTSVSEPPPAAVTAEPREPHVSAAAATVRVEPVDMIEVNTSSDDAERVSKSASSKPRIAVAPRVSVPGGPRASAAPLADPAHEERGAPEPPVTEAKQARPPEATPKRVNAWDPSAFGGRY
jgi:serine/threonine-protein kinase